MPSLHDRPSRASGVPEQDPVKDEEGAPLLPQVEGEVVQSPPRSERQRHRSMCMHAPSQSFVAMLQHLSLNSGPRTAASPRPQSVVRWPALHAFNCGLCHAEGCKLHAVTLPGGPLRSLPACGRVQGRRNMLVLPGSSVGMRWRVYIAAGITQHHDFSVAGALACCSCCRARPRPAAHLGFYCLPGHTAADPSHPHPTAWHTHTALGAPSAERACTSQQAVWLQDVWAGPPSTAPVVGLGQQTVSQPSLPSLVLPADKGILERSSSADVGSLLPLSNLDGPDTPPGYQPGSLLRSKSLGGSGSDEGSPGGSATPPMGAAAEREPLLPSLLLPAGAPLWDHRQRGCSPRVRCRELWCCCGCHGPHFGAAAHLLSSALLWTLSAGQTAAASGLLPPCACAMPVRSCLP